MVPNLIPKIRTWLSVLGGRNSVLRNGTFLLVICYERLWKANNISHTHSFHAHHIAQNQKQHNIRRTASQP